jgi:hypothetical protein
MVREGMGGSWHKVAHVAEVAFFGFVHEIGGMRFLGPGFRIGARDATAHPRR